MCIKKMSTEQFIEKSIKKHGTKFDYSLCTYNEYLKPVTIKCNMCNKTFYPTPSNHLSGTGCPHCNSKKQRITTEQFIKISVQIHGDKYDYSKTKYTTAKNKVEITCKKCNVIFKQLPRSHIYEKSGCPKCRMSHGEERISIILKSLNIDFETQYTFIDCCGLKGKKLPFDFYIKKFHICIEYDGKQHYDKNSKFWNIDIEINDAIKNNYCLSNNIKLIRINDKEFDNIEHIIRDNLTLYQI